MEKGLFYEQLDSFVIHTFDVFDDKQLVGIVEGQSESSKRFIYNSTNSVLERMEWYRTTKKNDRRREVKISSAANSE